MSVQTYVAVFEAESEEAALARLGNEGVIMEPLLLLPVFDWLPTALAEASRAARLREAAARPLQAPS